MDSVAGIFLCAHWRKGCKGPLLVRLEACCGCARDHYFHYGYGGRLLGATGMDPIVSIVRYIAASG